jgi:hypothetical protein
LTGAAKRQSVASVEIRGSRFFNLKGFDLAIRVSANNLAARTNAPSKIQTSVRNSARSRRSPREYHIRMIMSETCQRRLY